MVSAEVLMGIILYLFATTMTQAVLEHLIVQPLPLNEEPWHI